MDRSASVHSQEPEPPIPVISEEGNRDAKEHVPQQAFEYNHADKFFVPPTDQSGLLNVHPDTSGKIVIDLEAEGKIIANSERDDREETICGLRRKVFWIALSIAALVVIAAIVGGVVGAVTSNKENASSVQEGTNISRSNATTTDGSPTILPGTFLAATSYEREIHLFYQVTDKGIYHVYCFSDCANSSTVALVPDTDAKLYTPVATIGGSSSSGTSAGFGSYGEIYLYYINESNDLREKVWRKSDESWSDGPLNSQPLTRAYEKSGLAAIQFSDGDERRIYYQQSDLWIHEASFTQGGTAQWKPDSTISTEAVGLGTKIASSIWYDDNRHMEVYYQARNGSLVGRRKDPNISWRTNIPSPMVLPSNASLAGVGIPGYSVFTAVNRTIVAYQYVDSVWEWESPRNIARIQNDTYSIATAQWGSQNRTWIFYQESDTSLNVVDTDNNGDTWNAVKTINITNVS